MTLKKRIIIIIFVVALITFMSVALVSYASITSLLNNKINDNIKVNINQIRLSLENTIKNLNYVSQQLSYEGTVGNLVAEYLDETQGYRYIKIIDEIKANMRFIRYTNPNIGFTTYYFADTGEYHFNEFNVKEGMSIFSLPEIESYHEISYYGPHKSISTSSDEYVLSALRKVDIPGRDDVFIYLESDFNITMDILESTQLAANSHVLILDNEEKIVYTELPSVFQENTKFNKGKITNEEKEDILSGIGDDFYWFMAKSNQGWSLVTIITRKDYNKERLEWTRNIIFASIFSLIISFVLGFVLWRIIYHPLYGFEKEIALVSDNQLDTKPHLTNVPEFDNLLNQLQRMKEQIKALIHKNRIQEQTRSELELEKLRSQINPHFLMNTLNTVHWMAIMNNQIDIDNVIMSLNKLLAYNLRKEEEATLAEELEATKLYLSIQKIRYDIKFDISINVSEDITDMPVPRFMLQPLVENSLFHGIKEGGEIGIEVHEEDKIVICIKDNGIGMNEKTMADVKNGKWPSSNKSIGMGIGINYVRGVLSAFYKGEEELIIDSEKDIGTEIYIKIPYIKG